MSGYLAMHWSDFSVAVVGAFAALTGLLFVAVSINLDQILAMGTLAGRALSTMILFVVPLLVGILVLVPDQSPAALGLELRGTGMAAGGGLLWINRPAGRGELEPRWSWLLVRLVRSVTIPLFLVLAGAGLITRVGGGLYWIAPRSSRPSSEDLRPCGSCSWRSVVETRDDNNGHFDPVSGRRQGALPPGDLRRRRHP